MAVRKWVHSSVGFRSNQTWDCNKLTRMQRFPGYEITQSICLLISSQTKDVYVRFTCFISIMLALDLLNQGQDNLWLLEDLLEQQCCLCELEDDTDHASYLAVLAKGGCSAEAAAAKPARKSQVRSTYHHNISSA